MICNLFANQRIHRTAPFQAINNVSQANRIAFKAPTFSSTFSGTLPAAFTHYHRRSAPSTAPAATRRHSTVVMASGSDKTKVLFVCLGNICRSPTAEAVFRATVERAGMADRYSIDSCGTGGGSSNWYLDGGFSYHEGDPADPRMTRVAANRGVRLTSLSRPLTPSDLDEFDVILGMDDSNLAAIRRAAQHWKKEGKLSANAEAQWEHKVELMTKFIRDQKFKKYDSIPDPYYGGEKGFELVLDLLDDACEGLLEAVEAGKAGTAKQ